MLISMQNLPWLSFYKSIAPGITNYFSMRYDQEDCTETVQAWYIITKCQLMS